MCDWLDERTKQLKYTTLSFMLLANIRCTYTSYTFF